MNEVPSSWDDVECSRATPELTFTPQGIYTNLTEKVDVSEMWIGYFSQQQTFQYYGKCKLHCQCTSNSSISLDGNMNPIIDNWKCLKYKMGQLWHVHI